MFKSNKSKRFWLLSGLMALSVLFLSIPYLIEGGLMASMALLAFIPLFILDYYCYRNKVAYSCWIFYLLFVLWNLATTFWVYNATSAGGIAAILLNAVQMSGVLWLFRVFRRALDRRAGNQNYRVLPYIFFIAAWLTWEHYYFDAEVSWPWLVLGNAFATAPKMIQWYEYTGVLGGSLWILLSGFIGFHLFFIAFRKLSGVRKWVMTGLYLCLLILPTVVSRCIYASYEEKENPREFVVLQPNIDPYKDKFQGMTREQQDLKLLRLAEEAVTDATDVVLAPETFTSYIDEDRFENFPTVRRVNAFVEAHPNINFIMGAISVRYYLWNLYPGSTPDSKPTLSARKGNGYWYDAFNSSFIVDSSGRHDFFHKSKLVVLAEYVPFPKLLERFSGLMLELGGTVSSYGTQDEVTIFKTNDSTGIGTAICYESVYGEYFTEYVRKGAQVMTVITNDGWWKNTPGHRQHLRYAQLRAIETRRSIARSANTGISALIDQRGDVIQRSAWWKDAVLRGDLNLNDDLTVYVKYGDYIGRAAQLAFALFFLFMLTVFLYPKPDEGVQKTRKR